MRRFSHLRFLAVVRSNEPCLGARCLADVAIARSRLSRGRTPARSELGQQGDHLSEPRGDGGVKTVSCSRPAAVTRPPRQ